MAPSDSFNLNNHKDLLIKHEQEFRKSYAGDRDKVVNDIILDIQANNKAGDGLSTVTKKGLAKVCWLIHVYYSLRSHLPLA